MVKKGVALAMPVLCCLLLLAGCTKTTASNTDVLVRDGKKTVFVGDYVFRVPEDWSVIRDINNYSGYYVTAPDGAGVLFATFNNWSPMDLSNTDNATYVLKKTLENFAEKFSGFALDSQEEGEFKGKASMESFFLMTIIAKAGTDSETGAERYAQGLVRCYSLMFIHKSDVYSFIFVLPEKSGGQLEESITTITDTIA